MTTNKISQRVLDYVEDAEMDHDALDGAQRQLSRINKATGDAKVAYGAMIQAQRVFLRAYRNMESALRGGEEDYLVQDIMDQRETDITASEDVSRLLSDLRAEAGKSLRQVEQLAAKIPAMFPEYRAAVDAVAAKAELEQGLELDGM